MMAKILKGIISIGLAFNILLLPKLSLAWQKTIKVITEPLGAIIYVDGIKVGKSPCYIKMEQGLFQGKSHLIKAEKKGYKVALRTIKPSEVKTVLGINSLD